MKKQVTDWGKLFEQEKSDKETLSKTYEGLLKFNPNKVNSPVKKWGKCIKRHLTKEDTHVINELVMWTQCEDRADKATLALTSLQSNYISVLKEHMQRCSTSCVIKQSSN